MLEEAKIKELKIEIGQTVDLIYYSTCKEKEKENRKEHNKLCKELDDLIRAKYK